MNKDSEDSLTTSVLLLQNVNYIQGAISKPLSVLFDADRTEDYDEGGEVNLGGGMDTKSGIFTAPLPGVYSFTITSVLRIIARPCSPAAQWESSGLILRSNHESNHKNSMVYLFTNTGLLDKLNNHLTHFTGMFLRPKNFLLEEHLTNGPMGMF
ncbi:Caprin2like [Caligus rogercresseyi]|uniref:Caprin2like n=1 Tax=Caligus rogercresseyi TaxID=217165 RepID=A0A7T8JVA1_CALRO|nr:Caprin2like [Caligus rogercresseyi]